MHAQRLTNISKSKLVLSNATVNRNTKPKFRTDESTYFKVWLIATISEKEEMQDARIKFRAKFEFSDAEFEKLNQDI